MSCDQALDKLSEKLNRRLLVQEEHCFQKGAQSAPLAAGAQKKPGLDRVKPPKEWTVFLALNYIMKNIDLAKRKLLSGKREIQTHSSHRSKTLAEVAHRPPMADAYIKILLSAKADTKCSSQPNHREKALVRDESQTKNDLPPRWFKDWKMKHYHHSSHSQTCCEDFLRRSFTEEAATRPEAYTRDVLHDDARKTQIGQATIHSWTFSLHIL